MAVSWRLERPEIAEEVEGLALLIRETTGNLITFALYRSVADREAAVRALKERLPVQVVEFTLSKDLKNPVTLLQRFPSSKRVCLFFYDVEEAFPDSLGYVNLQREAFGEVSHAVVFFVREYGLREIATRAPDFWSWRSGVFDFRSERERAPLRAVHTALAEPFFFSDRGDLERRGSLYQGLIREYSKEENPNHRFLVRLQLRLGAVFFLLYRLEKAEACFHDSLETSRKTGDQHSEAGALHSLGIVAATKGKLEEAGLFYRQSLEISESHGNEEGQARTFHNLGQVALEDKRLDESESWTQKSLEVYQRLGLEADLADGYHQLGIIAQERGRFDEAEALYRKALENNERLGLKGDTAINYHQLGIIAQERGRFDEAEALYRKALEVKESLAHPPLRVNTLAQLGVLRRLQGRLDEAVGWFAKAFGIAREYEMPVINQILADLSRLLDTLGIEGYTRAWRQGTGGQEPPFLPVFDKKSVLPDRIKKLLT